MLPIPPSSPRVGDLVRYAVAGGRSAGDTRPAIITRVDPRNGNRVTLQVFGAGVHDAGSELDRGGMGYQGVIEASRGAPGDRGTWWPIEDVAQRP